MAMYPPGVPKSPSKHRLLLALMFSVALVASACTNSGSDTSTTTATEITPTVPDASTTTTEAPLTSIPPNLIPGDTSDSISPDTAAAIRADIGVLLLNVEESRGLPFLTIPAVTILDSTDFTARVRSVLEDDLDQEEIDGYQALYELLGMLDGTIDLYELFVDLYTEQVAGFYDPDSDELVVPVSVDGITPFQEITITHELTHALTDQHFDFNDVYEQRIDTGNGDDTYGVLGLVEGDATYQQFLFLESMDPADALSAVIESLGFDTTILDNAPTWLQKDLAFPYEHGFLFTTALVKSGGLKGIDEAYLDLPISSEQILHPEKFTRSEQPSPIDPLTVELNGWTLFDEATFGEWGIRLLLLDSLPPGQVTQAAAGWGNDTYRVFIKGEDTAIAWVYSGETVSDAEDLADGLIAHIRSAMDAGSSLESGGGLLFDTGSTYVFIDRVDSQIFFVASTSQSAGADLRTQLNL